MNLSKVGITPEDKNAIKRVIITELELQDILTIDNFFYIEKEEIEIRNTHKLYLYKDGEEFTYVYCLKNNGGVHIYTVKDEKKKRVRRNLQLDCLV